MTQDEFYLKQVLRLARQGRGRVSPNPMVGALIAKNGEIIGQGYHRRYGGKHAEVNAMENARGDIKGATLYVNLEPCPHYGKTPPCVDAIRKANLGKVVIGTIDPNPLVNGKGIQRLREGGIETEVGVLEGECYALNEVYFKYVKTGMPYVTLKFAQTLDGRIATVTGDSRWISSDPFLKLAHRLRALHDGILVGIGTILADNPQLTVRLVKGRNPIRIVVDSELGIPHNAQVLQNQQVAPTIIAITEKAEELKRISLSRMGIELLVIQKDKKGEVDLRDLLRKLGQKGISSLLVEGGQRLITSLLQEGLMDKVIVAIAPKILGKGIESIGDLGIKQVGQALKLSSVKTYKVGEDVVIEGTLGH